MIPSARTVRASRKNQSDAQQSKVARVRAIRQRQHKLEHNVNIDETVRIGASTCDANARLNYVITTRIYVWNGDPEHMIYVISYFTKHTLKISGIKFANLKMLWLIKHFILPFVHVAVIGVLIILFKFVYQTLLVQTY